jgi:hypothetical protein
LVLFQDTPAGRQFLKYYSEDETVSLKHYAITGKQAEWMLSDKNGLHRKSKGLIDPVFCSVVTTFPKRGVKRSREGCIRKGHHTSFPVL